MLSVAEASPVMREILRLRSGRQIEKRCEEKVSVLLEVKNLKTHFTVDGGMVASNYTMQFLADILNAHVDRPMVLETTALGAAYLAGLYKGMFPAPDQFSSSWKRDKRFAPCLDEDIRCRKYSGWKDAVRRTLS